MTKTRKTQPTADRGPDVFQTVTGQIVAALEAGTKPWEQPWTGSAVLRPLRFNGERYRGVNTLILWMAQTAAGYRSPYWMTFKQALELGGAVRKGEKSTRVVYYGQADRKEEGEGGDDAPGGKVRFLKTYCVFNVDQIDGLPARYAVQEETAPVGTVEQVAAAEAFFANIPAVIREGGSQAYYAPGPDEIHMPPLSAFRDGEFHAITLGHELIHWTKHPTRLDRDMGRGRGEGARDAYAREEIVAELGAAFLGAELGLRPDHINDHASYIAGWIKALKNDSRLIFTAAAHAQRAFDLLQSYQAVSLERAA